MVWPTLGSRTAKEQEQDEQISKDSPCRTETSQQPIRSFNCSVVDNKQIDIRSETAKNVGLTPPDRQITRNTEEQFPPRTSTTINVTLTQ